MNQLSINLNCARKASFAVARLARISTHPLWCRNAPLEWRMQLRRVLVQALTALEEGSYREANTIARKELDSFPEMAFLAGISKSDVAEMVLKDAEPLPLEGSPNLDFVRMILDALDRRVPGAICHGFRVGLLADTLARTIGAESIASSAFFAGLTHEIGKAWVRDGLLLKPGPLSSCEWDEIKRHPAHGADCLAHFPDLRLLVPAVRHHHECFNGGGYPDKLSGQEIPLLARILAICSSYISMRSTRPYRDSLSSAEALEEIGKGMGSQFDPSLALTFITMHLGGQPESGAVKADGDIHRKAPCDSIASAVRDVGQLWEVL